MLAAGESGGSAIKFGRHGDDYVRGIGKACNCFVAGTAVDTPDGSVPIEELDVGDDVLTRPEGCPECPPQTGRVARVFRRIAPAILWLTLATGEVVGTTPGHEVWTFERGWGPAAELTAGESFLTPAGAAATIVEIVIDPTPTPVYNFEVRGTHTYFAAGVWVHNDSCPIRKPLDYSRGHGGDLHVIYGINRAHELEAKYGETVRWNQALVDPYGRKLSSLRPDIQYIGPDGKVYIEEIVVSNRPGSQRASVFRQLLGSAFGGYREVYP